MPRRKRSDPVYTPRAKALFSRLVSTLEPPEEIILSRWAESSIVLPEGQSARPGRYKNWPYFVEILDSIGDLEVERVTLMKATRLGFTKGLVIAIGATAATDPCPMILLVPTDDDATGMAVDEVEPIFESSPAISALMRKTGGDGRKGAKAGRNTLVRKSFLGGGSLKILAARAPRNLRRHDAKKLYIDEADAMELTKEGDPIAIAERRTLAHADRKIVVGSTPTDEDTSVVNRLYLESDQRIFEVPCPYCGSSFEILWEHMRWSPGDPDSAHVICPHCEEIERAGGDKARPIFNRDKLRMVEQGAWRATKPEVKNHRGYRLNALVSLLANTSWPTLVAEWLRAKRGGPSMQQPFVNLTLAKPWKSTLNSVSADILLGRAEPFGLSRLPPWVVMMTAGVDVQDEWIDVTLLGWGLGESVSPTVLAHIVLPGNTLQPEVWRDLDKLSKERWQHPNGWMLGVDAMAVDSGGREGRTQVVYDWTRPRLSRRIFAIKGDDGPSRPVWKKAAKVKGGYPLFIIGKDTIKTLAMERLAEPEWTEEPEDGREGTRNPFAMRFSEDLDFDWYEQATAESRRIRYVKTTNRAVIEFVPKRAGARVEALDDLCYGWAVRLSPAVKAINLQERAARRPTDAQKPKSAGEWAAMFNG
jgi:phage terminase large subunit GpA-like protein